MNYDPDKVSRLLRFAGEPVAHTDDKSSFLLESLVPMRMLELRGFSREELVDIAHAQADAVTEKGDAAFFGSYGGRHGKKNPEGREGLTAAVTGLAALALLGETGVTVAGMHWCVVAHEGCPEGGPTMGGRIAPPLDRSAFGGQS